MSNADLRNLTNNFQDVRLASLRSWKQASEFPLRDHGGPYVVMQEGFDPADPKLIADEFVLGRSGKWLSVAYFYRMPVPERRAEFIFNSAAEVMQMMGNLSSKAEVIHPGAAAEKVPADAEPDDMAAAIQATKK